MHLRNQVFNVVKLYLTPQTTNKVHTYVLAVDFHIEIEQVNLQQRDSAIKCRPCSNIRDAIVRTIFKAMNAHCKYPHNGALAAAHRTRAHLRRLNGEIGPGGPLNAGIALHLGEVTYGNVGTAERLDFTVIGPAANEVARLGELCKELRQEILVSQDVARYLDGRLHSLGRHCLRGIQESHELFTILDENC